MRVRPTPAVRTVCVEGQEKHRCNSSLDVRVLVGSYCTSWLSGTLNPPVTFRVNLTPFNV